MAHLDGDDALNLGLELARSSTQSREPMYPDSIIGLTA